MNLHFKKLTVFFLSLAVGVFVITTLDTIIALQHEVDELKTAQAKLHNDLDALWLNQKEMVGTINQSVNAIEQLKDEQSYIDPDFDLTGIEIPVSPIDNRF